MSEKEIRARYRVWLRAMDSLGLRAKHLLLRVLLSDARSAAPRGRSFDLCRFGIRDDEIMVFRDAMLAWNGVRILPSPDRPGRWIIGVPPMPRWLNMKTYDAFRARHGLPR